jgi:hypothetical protein
MIDAYGLLAMTAALIAAAGVAVLIFRRIRIGRAYDEMRRLYGKDWAN